MLDRPILFLSTTDPDLSRRFYEETLGFEFVADEHTALVFNVAGTPLRVQKVPSFEPAPSTVLGWWVEQIHDAIRVLAAKGVVFERYEALPQDDDGVWEIPGVAKVAWFKDPDGNILSLTESETAG